MPGSSGQTFDHAYFKKFYYSPATRVTTRAEMKARADMIAAVLTYAELPVRSILDAGCGIGLMRPAFKASLPKARYTGLEASEYLCRRYGWVRDSIARHRPKTPFDLVVCYDVLQYLDDREAAQAVENFKNLTRCALYFSALTVADWRANCDRSRTDSNARIRSGDWYRRRLRRHFRHFGYGIWVRKDLHVIRWDLES